MKVTVDDGATGEVRRLRFLELEDELDYNVDPPYVHKYKALGGVQEVQYVLSDWTTPPIRPDVPIEEAQPDTAEFAQWQSHTLYQAVLRHEYKRAEQTRQYMVDVSRHIKRTCVDDDFRPHIISPKDFSKVEAAAICPEVSKEDLEAELARTFQCILAGYAHLRGVGPR
jgi:hypothetical protein